MSLAILGAWSRGVTRWRWAPALGLALLLAVGAPAAGQSDIPSVQPTSAAMGGTSMRQLDNGLQVIVVRNAAIPFATVMMAFRGGALAQLESKDFGVPHLLEHMLFRKMDRGGEGTFNRQANEIDALWNGATSEESVSYYLTVPSRHIGKAIDLMSYLVRRADFTPDGLDVERRVVEGELQRRAAEPMMLLRTAADRQLWQDSAWSRKNPGGNVLAVNQAWLDQLKQMHKTFYVPNNALFVVAGDVSADQVHALVDDKFRKWKPGPDPMASVPPLVVPPLAGIGREFVIAPVRNVTFLVRWHGPSLGDDRGATYAADVFSGIVNQTLSGTQRRLVEGGFFQSVSLSYDTKRYVGPIELYATTTPELAVRAAVMLGVELSRLVGPNYFNAADLATAKKRERVLKEFRSESASNVADMLAATWSAADLDYQLAYADSIEARTMDDIQRYIRVYLKGRPMNVTVMMSTVTQQAIALPLRNALATWKVP